ncbi:unnamed protein product, partial [Gongylonema pulchrum]|uniref:Prolyl endopeptidase n=1 Tax=Gongylonema pulchrum TaxID=637853 RepID=A0A183D2Z6_9BILA
MTADHDDRVIPAHTLKYMARLYEAARASQGYQKKPLIARVELNDGHGTGKPFAKVIAEIVDMYCFVQRVLDI